MRRADHAAYHLDEISDIVVVLRAAGSVVNAMELQSACDTSLRFAIANTRLIGFLYNAKRRVAEPHDYGVKDGVARLLVYQVRGESSTTVRGWKLLDLSKIEQLAVLDDRFRGTRARPNQHHVHWDELYARVR